MGDPRRLKRKYSGPKHPWEKQRIDDESELVKEYGLKNKKEVWKAAAIARRYKSLGRKLIGLSAEEKKQGELQLVSKLVKEGFLKDGSTLDNVLSMTVRDILERRLQTIVWKKGMALTVKQARQFITHGHIKIKNRSVSTPGRLIGIEPEKEITWTDKSIETIKPGTMSAEDARKKAEEKEVEMTSVRKVEDPDSVEVPVKIEEKIEKEEEVAE